MLGLTALLSGSVLSVAELVLSTLLFLSLVSMFMPWALALPSTFVVSVAMPRLSIYIFQFFYCKSQLYSQPRIKILSKVANQYGIMSIILVRSLIISLIISSAITTSKPIVAILVFVEYQNLVLRTSGINIVI